MKNNFKSLFKLLKNYRFSFYLAIFLVLIEAFLVIIAPKVFGEAINVVFYGFKYDAFKKLIVNIDFNLLNKFLISLVIIYVSITLVNYFRQFLVRRIVTIMIYDLRHQINQKINALAINTIEKHQNGDLISLVVNDSNTVLESLPELITQSVYSLIVVLGILIMMLSISFEMTLIALTSVPFIMFIGFIIMKNGAKYFKANQIKIAKMNSFVDESYDNFLTIKSYQLKNKWIAEFKKINDDLTTSTLKAQFLSGLIFPITGFINNIAYVIIIIFASFKVLQGHLSIGSLQSFIQYNQQFTSPLQQIAQLSNNLQLIMAAINRIDQFLALEELKDDSHKLVLDDFKGDIVFKDVNFSYQKSKKIIDNFNLVIKKGTRVAIVGKTGAGKTTLINLLMRFYEIDSGVILLDGINIKDLKRSELARNCAMVLQDAWLFQGTILENIAYGQVIKTEAEIIKASQLANAHHFIQTLKDGYHTMINEDASNLSAGQKQLLMIARAFLGNKKLLILDEATSSIDTRTEKLVQQAMDKLMVDKTCFIIAHRLSTIKNADIILYMEDGMIKEKGTHNELLTLNGSYARLYYSQFED